MVLNGSQKNYRTESALCVVKKHGEVKLIVSAITLLWSVMNVTGLLVMALVRED